MTRVLLICLVSCLATVNQAMRIRRCDLAKLLHEERVEGLHPDVAPSKTLSSLSQGLCLAAVVSNFNVSKVNENADGSFDYGIFQINSHYWCTDYLTHSENLCRVDCQDLLGLSLVSAINCAKKITTTAGGMANWVEWELHCSGRPLNYWMTGCHLK